MLIGVSFSFSILLPATLATHDYHQFGRISYILTARVEGIPSTSTNITSLFRKDKTTKERTSSTSSPLHPDIPFREDFESVIARSDKITQDMVRSRSSSRRGSSSFGGTLIPPMQALGLSGMDDQALSMDDGLVLGGLYHRRSSGDHTGPNSPSGTYAALPDDARSIVSVSTVGEKSDKSGWMKGDLTVSRSLIIHANPSLTDGVCTLDVRKEGLVEGLNSWRFTASSEAVRRPLRLCCGQY
jgi:hypothetical protein